MRGRIIAFFLACSVFQAALCSTVSGSGAVEQSIQILSADEYGLTLELTLPPFKIEEIRDSDGTHHKLFLEKWAKISQPGHPELPFKSLLIQIPRAGLAKRSEFSSLETQQTVDPSPGGILVSVLGATYETLPNYHASPAPLPSRPVPLIYQSSEFYPQELAVIDSKALIRGVPVARLNIFPFQWNPLSGELRYATRLRLQVQFDNPLPVADKRVLAPLQSVKEPFRKSLQDLIINYSGPEKSIESVSPMAAPEVLAPPEGKEGFKFGIKKAGLYRLSYEDLSGYLLAAGSEPGSIDPGTFRLFHRDRESAIHVVSPGVRFSPGDYLEFYAREMDSPYTDVNVYRLYWGEEAGKRIGLADGALSGEGTETSSFFHRLRIEENHTLWENMPKALENDYWFWEKMTSPFQKEYSLFIPSPLSVANAATIRISFQGRSVSPPHPNHHTLVYLNGAKIGDASWDGQVEYVQEMTVSQEMLRNGVNSLRIELPGDAGAAADIIYLNWIEVDYWRRLEVVQDELFFNVSGSGPLRMTVKGLNRPDIRILDVTNPEAVRELTGFAIEPDGAAYQAVYKDQTAGARNYYIITDPQVKKPDSVTFMEPSDLKSPENGADYILITAREFLAAVAPARLFRTSQGMRVKTVSAEEIYDVFNYGLIDPRAIKDFLAYAYRNWTPPAPTYVFLVGDANTDYRDYLGTGKTNKVPVHLSWTDNLGITPDDNWYVSVEGEDELPDMFIGRIPGKRAEDVAAVIEKIIRYGEDQEYRPKGVLFVADNNELSFDNLNENLIRGLPAGYIPHRIYLRSYQQVAAATADIIARINEGMLLVNYTGHGAVTNWAGEFLFESADVESLANGGRLPFIVTLNCLNGYFSQPFKYSLAEAFLAAREKGAVANFSPSGLGYEWEHEILAGELFARIFRGARESLGAITTQAKIAAYARGTSADILKTFTLFGDPATRLKGIIDPRGDITGDGLVDLADALAGLQAMAGLAPAAPLNREADINGDGRIGLEDILYALRLIASEL